MMGTGAVKIRPFREDDAPSVAALWQYWFRDQTREPDAGLVELVRRIYIEDPNRDDEVTPLVAEDEAGNMLGFLGASVMPVEVDGARGKLAGVFPSVVDPEAPSTVASFLLRKFLAGPQLFTFSDGGHVKFERIWETLGGQINHLQSLRWVKFFRPAQIGARRFQENRGLWALRPLATPIAKGFDWSVRRILWRQLGSGFPDGAAPEVNDRRFGVSDLQTENLTPERLVHVSDGFHRRARLRPLYTAEHMTWQLQAMARIVSQGDLTANLILTPEGVPMGWYIYYLNPGGVSRVFALESDDRYLPDVIDHLFRDADQRGAGALIGRMEPKLRRPMSARGVFVHSGGSLQMIHSKDKSLMDSAQLGRAAFNRLQGENWYWWAIVADQIP